MHMQTAVKHRGAGFTLLEAIVALTIIGLVLIPLVSFIGQAANQLGRAADSNDQSFAKQSALALMEPINPLTEPHGTLDLDRTITVSWQSQPIIEPSPGILAGTGLPAFRIGFYDVHVSLTRDGSTPWFDFDLRKVGYERIAAGNSSGFGR